MKKGTIDREFERTDCPFCASSLWLRNEEDIDTFSCDWCHKTFIITILKYREKQTPVCNKESTHGEKKYE